MGRVHSRAAAVGWRQERSQARRTWCFPPPHAPTHARRRGQRRRRALAPVAHPTTLCVSAHVPTAACPAPAPQHFAGLQCRRGQHRLRDLDGAPPRHVPAGRALLHGPPQARRRLLQHRQLHPRGGAAGHLQLHVRRHGCEARVGLGSEGHASLCRLPLDLRSCRSPKWLLHTREDALPAHLVPPAPPNVPAPAECEFGWQRNGTACAKMPDHTCMDTCPVRRRSCFAMQCKGLHAWEGAQWLMGMPRAQATRNCLLPPFWSAASPSITLTAPSFPIRVQSMNSG